MVPFSRYQAQNGNTTDETTPFISLTSRENVVHLCRIIAVQDPSFSASICHYKKGVVVLAVPRADLLDLPRIDRCLEEDILIYHLLKEIHGQKNKEQKVLKEAILRSADDTRYDKALTGREHH